MMPKITYVPEGCKQFFRRLRRMLSPAHFAHLWRLVLLVALLAGRRSLSRFTVATQQRRTRQAIAHFLEEDLWDSTGLLRHQALQILRQLGWHPGQTVCVILDDTQQRKRAKKMDAVQKWYLHAEKVYAPAHVFVSCALLFCGVLIPYGVRMWLPGLFCRRQGVRYQKLTDIAAQMVAELALPDQGNVIVLFDAYYLCPAVVQACQRRGWAWISVAKKNRNFFPQGRPRDKRKVGRYGQNVLRRDAETIQVDQHRYRVAQRVGQLSKAGRVKMVFSRPIGQHRWAALVTNQLHWNAKTVVEHYLHRWRIEVFFKMAKQHLGLGDYQLLRYQAIENYLRLVLLAYLLLTHQALQTPDVQAQLRKGSSVLRLPSIPQLQQQLRIALWQESVQRLANRFHNGRLARKIKDFLQYGS